LAPVPKKKSAEGGEKKKRTWIYPNQFGCRGGVLKAKKRKTKKVPIVATDAGTYLKLHRIIRQPGKGHLGVIPFGQAGSSKEHNRTKNRGLLDVGPAKPVGVSYGGVVPRDTEEKKEKKSGGDSADVYPSLWKEKKFLGGVTWGENQGTK